MTFDFAAARQIMVDTQVRVNDVTDLTIQTAMRQVPREAFCPEGHVHMAYADAEVAYAPGRWLLRPRDAAKLLQVVACVESAELRWVAEPDVVLTPTGAG